MKILIAEDDENSIFLLQEMFEGYGTDFLVASNGQEAVKVVDKNPEIDFVLMDLKMPIMDGFEATRIIKSKYPQIPIIAQTAYAFSDDAQKALSIGCDSYVSKPIERIKLFSVINHLLKKKKS